MPRPSRVGSLEVAEDPDLERRTWRVERLGWALMALFVLSGLAGLLGAGPLSKAEAQAGGMSISYPRFARELAPVRLDVSFGPAAVRDGEVRIWLEESYYDRVRVERIEPEPQGVQVGGGRLVYAFALAPQQRRGKVTFHLQFDGFGLMRGRAGTGEDAISFRQLVFP